MRYMKYALLAGMIIIFACTSLYAQTAKIISVEGEVNVRADANSDWQNAKPQQYLSQDAEIKTAEKSKCILSFDEDLANIITIDENTQVKLKNLKPVEIILPRGRVFLLIDDKTSSLKPFEVRTPTAVAGVRGTGESVEFYSEETIIQCFEGKVYVQGLNSEGRKMQTKTLSEGKGIKIVSGGHGRNPFKITVTAYETWYDHKMKMEELQKTLPVSIQSAPVTIKDKGEEGKAGPLIPPTYKTMPSYNLDAIKKLNDNK